MKDNIIKCYFFSIKKYIKILGDPMASFTVNRVILSWTVTIIPNRYLKWTTVVHKKNPKNTDLTSAVLKMKLKAHRIQNSLAT